MAGIAGDSGRLPPLRRAGFHLFKDLRAASSPTRKFGACPGRRHRLKSPPSGSMTAGRKPAVGIAKFGGSLAPLRNAQRRRFGDGFWGRASHCSILAQSSDFQKKLSLPKIVAANGLAACAPAALCWRASPFLTSPNPRKPPHGICAHDDPRHRSAKDHRLLQTDGIYGSAPDRERQGPLYAGVSRRAGRCGRSQDDA